MNEGPRKLTTGELHVLKLIARGAGIEGWAPVSAAVSTLFIEQEPMRYAPMPKELCVYEKLEDDGRGRARLTHEGQELLRAQAWL